jgi:single-stranded-DNA-specific exonuclease
MLKKWLVKNIDSEVVADLSEHLALGAATASILAGRGISSPEEGRSFLSPSFSSMPDPFLLMGVEAAVTRLLKARHSGESVCIYGDYDVDGISGTALLVSFLRRCGLNCTYFIPNRFDDGYGLNIDSLGRIIDSGATLIVSVDCGITSLEEADFCRQMHIDLIIVDHHTPKSTVPNACAVINPLQSGCQYPFKSLAGVGVAFNLLVALRNRMRQDGFFAVQVDEPDVREWLDLVALGTIADVVPLTGQNRIYAHFGLKRLEASQRPGIEALKLVSGVKGTVSCGQVGFRLAPRLNAAGRMESAVPGVELLLGSDAHQTSALAGELDVANAERQSIEWSMFAEAVDMIEKAGDYPARRSIVLASATWHQGVVGIVASRIAERFYRPTILIALDDEGNGKGSGRSIPGFHLLEALNSCADYLDRFGGHRYAAGVGVKGISMNDFSLEFEKVAAATLGNAELMPMLEIDAEVMPIDVNEKLVNELKRLEPFGAGNPEPTLLLRGMKILDRRVVGEDHLKLRLSAGGQIFNAIAFRQSDFNSEGSIDVAFFPELNVWNNRETLQLRVKDMRPAEV